MDNSEVEIGQKRKPGQMWGNHTGPETVGRSQTFCISVCVCVCVSVDVHFVAFLG